MLQVLLAFCYVTSLSSFSFSRVGRITIADRGLTDPIISKTRLYSLGDPDLQPRWRFLRWWQDVARKVDDYLYPDEPDCPHWTFPSPVVWAPWMETIWFGNIYDYRAAFFSDVMYSNNAPFKEGALLFKDPVRATTLALLYQRYPKYSTASHSISNMTLFNIFGTETVRLGRYKVPLNDELILCTTDPLTKSEMKRYLNSFNSFKWFTNKFFQQKRKRQTLIRVDSAMPQPSSPSLLSQCDEDFLASAVYFLEDDRIARVVQERGHLALASTAVKIQSLTTSATTFSPSIQFSNRDMTSGIKSVFKAVVPRLWGIVNGKLLSAKEFSNDTCIREPQGKGFVVPLVQANSQYFVEILAHGILEHYAGVADRIGEKQSPPRILMGGDGRMLNKLAMELSSKVFLGSSCPKVCVSEEGLLTTGLAGVAVKAAKGASCGPFDLAIVFTGSGAMGGIKGYFGVRVIERDKSTKTVREWSDKDWDAVENYMARTRTIQAVPQRVKLPVAATNSNKNAGSAFATQLDVVPMKYSLDRYMKRIGKEFDFPKIKSFVDSSALIVSIDCGQSRACAAVCENVMEAIGLDKSTLLMSPVISSATTSSSDSSSAHIVNPTLASETVSVFGNAVTNWKDEIDLLKVEEKECGVERMARLKNVAKSFNGPDVGFVLDNDASDCAVACGGVLLSAQDARTIASSWINKQSKKSSNSDSNIDDTSRQLDIDGIDANGK